MDVPELRRAFLLGDTVAERIRRFRADRVMKIATFDTPTEMESGAKVLFHIVPLSAFAGSPVHLQLSREQRLHFAPPDGSGFRTRINLDGFVTYLEGQNGAVRYLQFFREGIIEVAQVVETDKNDKGYFIPSWYEEQFIEAGEGYLIQLQRMGITPPYYLFLSLHGVKGLELHVGHHYPRSLRVFADRDTLMLPEFVLEDARAIRGALISLYSVVWNAFGHEALLSFDASGRYVER